MLNILSLYTLYINSGTRNTAATPNTITNANASTEIIATNTSTKSANAVSSRMNSEDVVVEPNVDDDRTRLQVIRNIKELSLISYSEPFVNCPNYH
jgi:hypothetical protein